MKKQVFFLAMVFLLVIISNTKFVLSDPDLNQTNMTAQGGNVSMLFVNAGQDSSIWQGFFGTISGGFVLENAQGHTMYDWSIVQASGEVMASRKIISDWTSINCSNQTEIYEEEYRLNIPNSSVQGINDTFVSTAHPVFDIGYIALDNCRSTLTDNSTAEKVVFWNVILNTDENTTVYVSLVDDNTIGFNGTAVDYQLLVPTNLTTSTALYNLYLDLT